MSAFKIIFKDNQIIVFNDIIVLSQEQQDKILDYALNEVQDELKSKKTGYKIELNDDQIRKAIDTKNIITGDKSESELYNSNIIQFEGHSVERIIKRVGNTDSIFTFMDLIRKIKEADFIHHKAEWKGFPRLSYTYMKEGDADKYKFTLAFIKGGSTIKVVTVSNINIDEMDYRVTENEETLQRLLQFKEKLKKRLNS